MNNSFKKIGLFALFVFSTLFIQQCRDCPSKPVQQQRIDSYKFNQIYKLKSNGGLSFQNIDSVSMNNNDTMFLTFFSETKVVEFLKYKDGLMACDPVFPQTQSLGDSLKVIAATEFDSQHPIGSDLSDLFLISNELYGQTPSKVFYPLNQFIQFSNSPNVLTLALTKKPNIQNVKFKLVFYKQTAMVYNLETPSFRFY